MSQFLSQSCVSTIAARVYRVSTMSSSDLEEALRAQLPDSDDDFDWDAVPTSIMSGPLQFDEPTKQSQCTCAAYQYLCSISDKKTVLERMKPENRRDFEEIVGMAEDKVKCRIALLFGQILSDPKMREGFFCTVPEDERKEICAICGRTTTSPVQIVKFEI
ncbi:hypothetical protein L596_016604 [Steinernema carpocapsae]|uniref:Uncharacterized protein n=1 Tax=Steinernema carpocapsae TaxID=34508 RepID=A0A4V6A3J2_STECR|nr:hypothetical protein L596_016604 [Steinernema carpocapsae]